MLTLTDFRFAKVSELFRYKQQNFELPSFPGYSLDQWGIKAHNRPWIEEAGAFGNGQKIIEVGGAYSTLPIYLAKKYNLEAWIGDDFGESSGDFESWTRWGNPHDLPNHWQEMHYVFKPFGEFSKEYPDSYFNRVFSVSTLEHIPWEKMTAVLKDMHRILAPGGIELHTIDITPRKYRGIFIASIIEHLSITLGIDMFRGRLKNLSVTWNWLQMIAKSGVDISIINSNNYPWLDKLLCKETLFESYDVVYRFYP